MCILHVKLIGAVRVSHNNWNIRELISRKVKSCWLTFSSIVTDSISGKLKAMPALRIASSTVLVISMGFLNSGVKDVIILSNLPLIILIATSP